MRCHRSGRSPSCDPGREKVRYDERTKANVAAELKVKVRHDPLHFTRNLEIDASMTTFRRAA
jgi:CDGSH-type Zn-finger protein